jgi:hypothetical protein
VVRHASYASAVQKNEDREGDDHQHNRAIKSEFALAAKAVSIKGAMAGVWPPAMIGLGLVLTLAWSGSLLWLFVRMIIALV